MEGLGSVWGKEEPVGEDVYDPRPEPESRGDGPRVTRYKNGL